MIFLQQRQKQLTNFCIYYIVIKLERAQHFIAGWSSQVARRAHNPKVARFESRPRNHDVYARSFYGDVA